MISENDSDELFTVLCHSWKMTFYNDDSIKIILFNPNKDKFGEIIVEIEKFSQPSNITFHCEKIIFSVT